MAQHIDPLSELDRHRRDCPKCEHAYSPTLDLYDMCPIGQIYSGFAALGLGIARLRLIEARLKALTDLARR